MKTILFDLLGAQPEGKHKFHGGGEYIKALFKCICNQYLAECKLIIFWNKSLYIDQWIVDLIKQKNIITEDITTRDEIKNIFKKYKIDVFYSGLPYVYQNEWVPKTVKKRGTIHGLREIELPYDRYEYLYREKWLERQKCRVKPFLRKKIIEKHMNKFQNCIEFLDEIVCVSFHTKYAIQAYFPNNKKEIKVFYTPGKYVEGEFEEYSSFFSKYGKYILLISGERWSKNVYRAIMAIDELISQGEISDYKVVIIGKFSGKIKTMINNKDKFYNLDYLDTMELEAAYKYCQFFVYPTLNEGFGMPPIEAMKYGKTCIISAVCSLPEVYGDAVYYVNPYDIKEIQNRVLMASEKKIDSDIIIKRVNTINSLQQNALLKVCEFIVS